MVTDDSTGLGLTELEVARDAARIWEGAATEVDDRYTDLWGESARRLRVCREQLVIDGMDCRGALLIPIGNEERMLVNLGFLNPEAVFHTFAGGQVAHYYGWGRPAVMQRGERALIVVCDTFGTAARIHSLTGHPVAAILTTEVAALAAIKARYPKAKALTATQFDSEVANATRLWSFPDACKLLKWIRGKGLGEVSKKQVLQLGPASLRKAAAAGAALAALAELRWLRLEGGGRYRLASDVIAEVGPKRLD